MPVLVGGSQVNKFEQVSSNDCQISVVDDSMLPCDLFHDVCDVTYLLPPNRMTDAGENITFRQLPWRTVSGYHADTPIATKADSNVKAIWPSH